MSSTFESLPFVSIVIPAFNRVAPLRLTLASAQAAVTALGAPAEIILVDDGSEPPLAEILRGDSIASGVNIVRQTNQGSIAARAHGLQIARGEFVLFLDSDDLIAPAKLRIHLERLRPAGADISYDDVGEAHPDGSEHQIRFAGQPLRLAADVVDLLLRIQPPPHGPVYRRDYLERALARPLVSPLRKFDPVGDVWLYYNICPFPARIVKVDAPLTLIGIHDEARFSHHWERLGVASLGVMETFIAQAPRTVALEPARRIVGECAFISWRKLPRRFSQEFERRLLAIWRSAPATSLARLGGPLFCALARVIGPIGAGRVLRLRNAPYTEIQTIDAGELARLLHEQ